MSKTRNASMLLVILLPVTAAIGSAQQLQDLQQQLEQLKLEYEQKLQSLEQRISGLEKQKSQATASCRLCSSRANHRT
jgi:predicted PurR-regulated permease PerM